VKVVSKKIWWCTCNVEGDWKMICERNDWKQAAMVQFLPSTKENYGNNQSGQ
jgi:hypothetical protein